MNVLLIFVLVFCGAAQEKPPTAITPPSQDEIDKDIQREFPRLNWYRRKIAKKMKWPNMNELKYDKFDQSEVDIPFYTITTSFQGAVNSLLGKSEELFVEARKANKTLCEGDDECLSAWIIDPIYTGFEALFRCNKMEKGIGCTQYVFEIRYYPKRNSPKDWKTQPIGEPGSACDPGQYNKDGVCSLDPPTTTTTTFITTVNTPRSVL